MKVTFRAGNRVAYNDYPNLSKEEVYQEFIEWLLEVADASCEYEESSPKEDYGDDSVIPGMTDGSTGRTWHWEGE